MGEKQIVKSLLRRLLTRTGALSCYCFQRQEGIYTQKNEYKQFGSGVVTLIFSGSDMGVLPSISQR